MKKLISAACAASLALAAFTSCCNGGSCPASDSDNQLSKATIDSISEAQGNYIGQAVLSNFPMMQRQGQVSKDEIIRGIQTVFGAPQNQGTQIGIQFGLQMLNEMKQLEDMGIKVDRQLMLANFKKAFLQDSINQDEAQTAFALYQSLVSQVQAEMKARENARIAASPEALANVAAGEEYVAKAMAADPEMKTTSSGLVYKIEKEGEGTAVEGSTRLKLNYKETKIDGTELVSTPEAGRTAFINNLTPGFAEGLKMLKKGGSATFIVPLAYGVEGIPARNVGPNETIVYTVTVLEVE